MSRLRKNPKKLSYRKKLEKQLEKVQREAIIRRDGGCVFQGIFNHNCSPILQADHLISRRNASIFFKLENLNCVCSTINMIKGKGYQGWEYIQRFLEKRIDDLYGIGTVEKLEWEKRQPSKMDIDQLENLIHKYERMYRE